MLFSSAAGKMGPSKDRVQGMKFVFDREQAIFSVGQPVYRDDPPRLSEIHGSLGALCFPCGICPERLIYYMISPCCDETVTKASHGRESLDDFLAPEPKMARAAWQ